MSLTFLSHFEFFGLCALSLGLNSLIGLEREYKHKPAGLKTHVLIGVGATALTYLSSHFSPTSDPTRIAAQIVSGIGFIGAGTILQSQRSIQGLTTAATLWVSASIGMLVGALFIWPAVIVTATLFPFLVFSKKVTGSPFMRQNFSITVDISKLNVLPNIEQMIYSFDLMVDSKQLVRNQQKIRLEMSYSTNALTQHLFLKRLMSLHGIGEVLKI